MTPEDWRSPTRYEDLRSLDAPGFAWEYLRRNPEFQQDRAKLEAAARRAVVPEADLEAFAQRWGVRFRARCRHDRSVVGPLDRWRSPKRGRRDGVAG